MLHDGDPDEVAVEVYEHHIQHRSSWRCGNIGATQRHGCRTAAERATASRAVVAEQTVAERLAAIREAVFAVSAIFSLEPNPGLKGVRVRGAENAISVLQVPGSNRNVVQANDCK